MTPQEALTASLSVWKSGDEQLCSHRLGDSHDGLQCLLGGRASARPRSCLPRIDRLLPQPGQSLILPGGGNPRLGEVPTTG